jgi:hypothetical protein
MTYLEEIAQGAADLRIPQYLSRLPHVSTTRQPESRQDREYRINKYRHFPSNIPF